MIRPNLIDIVHFGSKGPFTALKRAYWVERTSYLYNVKNSLYPMWDVTNNLIYIWAIFSQFYTSKIRNAIILGRWQVLKRGKPLKREHKRKMRKSGKEDNIKKQERVIITQKFIEKETTFRISKMETLFLHEPLYHDPKVYHYNILTPYIN